MKYLKIAMLCSVVNFLANNRDKKNYHFAGYRPPFCFHQMKARLWRHISQAVEDGGKRL